MDRLTVQGHRFIDSQGRAVVLRGVNLGGANKMPLTEPTHIANNFSGHRTVSFIGRPFPREEAPEHYTRLRHWGFNCLRFLTTWEAIEHAGYGQYDTAYLDYLEEMVGLAGEYGFYVFIDPHQDVWSRMSGGDGAPGWTLEAAGFNLLNLDRSEAAITMQRRYPDYPGMIWTDNYSRLACRTMFTLFFAGDQFTPGLEVDGLPIQTYLQGAFIRAMQQVAMRVKDMPHVLGYDSLNEPGRGYIGLKSLQEADGFRQQRVYVTPAEGMLLGAGFPRSTPTTRYEGAEMIITGQTMLNPAGVSAWAGADLWQKYGVWGFDSHQQPIILKDDYFAGIDFVQDALIPFFQRYATAMREVHPEAIIFVETVPNEYQKLRMNPASFGSIVNASHWYDELMLFSKTFNGETAFDLHTMSYITGRENIARRFVDNIGVIAQVSRAQMGDIPTLIGEFGLAYDINQKAAYQNGDFALHELALSLYYDAMDANLAHSTQWNYTADNNNVWGDGWNLEDLSIFSRDQQHDLSDIHSGGRAIKGFCRPYIRRSGGQLVNLKFDHQTAEFTATIDFPESPIAPTEIYLPEIWYRGGFDLDVQTGLVQPSDDHAQLLLWSGQAGGRQTITICQTKM